jgi:ABC-type transport system involved in multi-copper enzyme maturation permease subunit
MMTPQLWRAEWLKMRKRPLNRSLLGFMLALILLVFGAMTAEAYFSQEDRAAALEQATSVLPYPRSLQTGIDLLANLGQMLVVAFVGSSVGGEYGRDTWKAILPRYASRTGFLLAKWTVGLAMLLLLIASMGISSIVFGWLGSLVLGIAGQPAAGPDTAELIRSLSVMFLDFTFLGTLTLLATVITRSSIGGTVVGVLSWVMLPIITQVLSLLVKGGAIISPAAHVNNVRVHWVAPDQEAIASLTALFNGTVSPLISLLVVLGYIAVLLGISLYIFKRRDMAGE